MINQMNGLFVTSATDNYYKLVSVTKEILVILQCTKKQMSIMQCYWHRCPLFFCISVHAVQTAVLLDFNNERVKIFNRTRTLQN